MTDHGGKPIRGDRQVPLSAINEGRFGRMFRRLPAAPPHDETVLAALADTMHETVQAPSGGWGTEPQPQSGGDNPAIPAAYTYLGQFIDHDLTFDPNSSLQQQNDPDALHDFRSPRFDLDSLYGSGPADEPFHYEPGTTPARLLLEPNHEGVEDLPRTSRGIAIIGDPRNDENIIVSQLQLVFLKLHNKLAAEVEADDAIDGDHKFAEAQRRVRWTYQQMVIHDYARRHTGKSAGSERDLVDELLTEDPTSGQPDFNLRYYLAKTHAYMPIEFSAAAFRFGHSQVRGVYDLNVTVAGRPVFLPGVVGPLEDLRGQRPLPAGWTIDWSHFVDLPGANPQPSRLIDTHLADGLFALPGKAKSLPLLNMLRGQSMDLPSGQDVARLMKAQPVLTSVELGPSVPDPTPLWFYILKEAEIVTGGATLGPVGARIVAEVLLGLLYNDKTSWINVDPNWRSTIPHTGEYPTLGDVVAFATT